MVIRIRKRDPGFGNVRNYPGTFGTVRNCLGTKIEENQGRTLTEAAYRRKAKDCVAPSERVSKRRRTGSSLALTDANKSNEAERGPTRE